MGHLTPRPRGNGVTFGRKVVAPPKNRAPKTAMPAKTDGLPPSEPRFNLDRASLVIDDGLLMVLGPDGDAVPPATVRALAADQPEAGLALDDGRTVRADRVAKVLEAQAGGRLAPASDRSDRWLKAMLGLEAAPAIASEEELEAERDDLEITLFGNELVISTAAGGSFVIAAARPDGTQPAAARLALRDGTPVDLEHLLTSLRRREDGGAAELVLPGCCFARDGEALVLTTAQRETFVFTAADDGAEGVALHTPDGESATFAELAEALGLIGTSPAPGAAPRNVEADAEQGDEPAEAVAQADDEAADSESAARVAAGHGANERETGTEQSQTEGACEPFTPARNKDADRRGDEACEMDDAPILGENAPAPSHARAAADGEALIEAEEGEPRDAPANESHRTLPCRLRVDDPSSVAVVLISGVPAGAELSAGSDSGDGSWTLSPDQLDALTINLPADAPEELTLEARLVAIDDRDGAMSTSARKVLVSREASDGAPQPSAPANRLRLDLDAVIREAAGDRPVSAVVVGGLPAGAKLSAGLFDDGIRSWVLRATELDDLELRLGAPASEPLELRVTVVTMDRDTGKPSAATRSIEVGPPTSPTVGLATDRPAERVGGVGFFRPLYGRRG